MTDESCLIVQPEEGMAPVLDFIAGATTSLWFKQFKFDAPELVEAVLAAHGRGVQVRGMLNATNAENNRYNDATFARFEEAGIPVRWTNPDFVVTHQKTLLADGARALISTFNLSPKYFGETRDLGLVVHVPALVAEIIACFEADWERRPFEPRVPELLWGNVNARLKMAAFIDAAEKHLDVYHPKFVDLPILDRLIAARERGVHVRLLCGGKHGIKTWDLLDTLSSLRALARAGVKVHRTKAFKVHLKLLVADKRRAIVGSMNIHRDAFDRRRELGMFIEERPIVDRLSQLFDRDWEGSHAWEAPDPLKPETHPVDELPHDPGFVHD
jgi:phosphatidylserine/phosphatidylglycerophosphate/cardiolipin synthase-like enzyme